MMHNYWGLGGYRTHMRVKSTMEIITAVFESGRRGGKLR